jgi:hypothetical protein
MLPADLPAALEPEGLAPYLRISATGVQIYVCEMKDGAATWAHKGPEAALFDAQKKPFGKH